MASGVRITGLDAVQRKFGRSATPAIRAGVKALALEVESKMAPYPPATIANSPDNPRLRWYERGYGPKWWVGGAATRDERGRFAAGPRNDFTYLMAARTRNIKKYGVGGITRRQVLAANRKGLIHGRKTSQMMNRGWSVKASGAIGWILGNRADYSGYLHDEDVQVSWAGRRGWITSERAIQVVIAAGTIQRIFAQAFRKLYER